MGDSLCAYLDANVPTNLGARIALCGCPNSHVIMGTHALHVATFTLAIHGHSRHVEMGAQNGYAHYEASTPRSRGNAHFDATIAH